MLELAFWVATALIFYTYIVYPAAISVIARTKAQHRLTEPDTWPSVAVICAVYNDRQYVAQRIENLMSSDYPGPLQIVLSLDGCTDDSYKIATKYPEVQVVSYPVRQGKPSALNRAVALQTADVLVFTDARQTLASNSIRNLVCRLQEQDVGAVSGELVHHGTDGKESQSIGLYWRYERLIRKSESRVYSLFGVTGALYAIRRCRYQPIAADTILDDFEIPIQILKRGERSVVETSSKIFDTLEESIAGERTRKIRTLSGNFQAFARNPWLFNPFKNPGVIQFVSHKVLRLVMPYCLLVTLASAIALDGKLYAVAAILQLMFYSLAVVGRLSKDIRQKSTLFAFPTTFVELNASAVLALGQYLFRRVDAKWERS